MGSPKALLVGSILLYGHDLQKSNNVTGHVGASPSKCVPFVVSCSVLYCCSHYQKLMYVRGLQIFTLPSRQPHYSWGDIWVSAQALCFYIIQFDKLQKSKVRMVICENNIWYLNCTVRHCNISVLTKISDFDVIFAQIRVE